jgi:hypothetical protein
MIADARAMADHWRDEAKKLERDLGVALALKKHAQKKPSAITQGRKHDSESVAVAIASDWHCSELVERETVNGRNEFNLSIAENRIKQFFRKTLALTETQRHSTRIDTLCLGLLGDFISGEIHEELTESNQLSATQEVLWVIERLRAGLEFLSPHYKRIVIPCCHGNHGRNTKKRRISTGHKHSYEWMMYHALKQSAPKNCEFVIADGYHVYLPVLNTKIRFHHGDAIRYQGGVGGIFIPVNKAIQSWNRNVRADLDVHGHFHQQLDGGNFICNGSLIGFNAFAVEIKAAYEPPQQSFFLIHSRMGKTVSAPIRLDEV